MIFWTQFYSLITVKERWRNKEWNFSFGKNLFSYMDFFTSSLKVCTVQCKVEKKYGNICTQPTERGHFRGYKLI